MLIGDGADVVAVRAKSPRFQVFEVTADYVNMRGFTVTGATKYPNAGIYIDSNVDHCNILHKRTHK
ncbi:MAG: hypothetical protein U9Q68_09885 [Euryarchaeota archaeon]|nr:hypothetical protein [Euryarchaeota archaeon]